MKLKVKVARKCYCEICEAIAKLRLPATVHETFTCAQAEDHECSGPVQMAA
jgi:hypothetical protein